MKHTYTLTFRGEQVTTFTSVHDEQAVRLGYRRNLATGQTRFDVPAGSIAVRPMLLGRMKTLTALLRTTDGPEWSTYPGQTFVVEVRPGTTEITDLPDASITAGA